MHPAPSALVGLEEQVGSEEVTVPLVLSRVFSQILPTLEPVLSQRGGPCASATGFRWARGLVVSVTCSREGARDGQGVRGGQSPEAHGAMAG